MPAQAGPKRVTCDGIMKPGGDWFSFLGKDPMMVGAPGSQREGSEIEITWTHVPCSNPCCGTGPLDASKLWGDAPARWSNLEVPGAIPEVCFWFGPGIASGGSLSYIPVPASNGSVLRVAASPFPKGSCPLSQISQLPDTFRDYLCRFNAPRLPNSTVPQPQPTEKAISPLAQPLPSLRPSHIPPHLFIDLSHPLLQPFLGHGFSAQTAVAAVGR